MPILPVLDLMQGKIVRGIGGRREEYRPIVSKLVDSAEPLAVASAFCVHFGFTELYVADLDAIQTSIPATQVYSDLRNTGFRLWIDAGIQTAMDAALTALLDLSIPNIIIGLESVKAPDELERIVNRAGRERIVFSLDLKNGKPLARDGAWCHADPWHIAEQAIALGVRRMIVLDLANVGTGAGAGTEGLCVRLMSAFHELELTAGGGVRDIADVIRLLECGIDFVLVASALHDGRITPDDVTAL